MTLVVADSGPLRYLVVIQAIGVLPVLFEDALKGDRARTERDREIGR